MFTLVMILLQLSLDFATIHVYHIISLKMVGTALDLKFYFFDVFSIIDFKTVDMKVITTNNVAF